MNAVEDLLGPVLANTGNLRMKVTQRLTNKIKITAHVNFHVNYSLHYFFITSEILIIAR